MAVAARSAESRVAFKRCKVERVGLVIVVAAAAAVVVTVVVMV